MSVIYKAKDSNVILAATPQADPAYEAQLRAKKIEFTTVTVTDPAPNPVTGATGTHAADLLPVGARVVYYRKGGGAVLASLIGRDLEYEHGLDRAGEQWAILELRDHKQAPSHTDMQRATVRGGTVQLDREDWAH